MMIILLLANHLQRLEIISHETLGEARHSGKKIDKKFNIVRPRFKRVIYSPLFKQDIFKLDEVFIRFAAKLEILMGVDPEYALREDKTNKMWTASRIHQFPSGGGFMSSHVDTACYPL